jgi:hypothetical protein
MKRTFDRRKARQGFKERSPIVLVPIAAIEMAQKPPSGLPDVASFLTDYRIN